MCQFHWNTLESWTEAAPNIGKNSSFWGGQSKPHRLPRRWKRNIRGSKDRWKIIKKKSVKCSSLSCGFFSFFLKIHSWVVGQFHDSAWLKSWKLRLDKHQCYFLTWIKNKYRLQACGRAVFIHRLKLKNPVPSRDTHKKANYKKFSLKYLKKFGWLFKDTYLYWSYILKQVIGFHRFSQKCVRGQLA